MAEIQIPVGLDIDSKPLTKSVTAGGALVTLLGSALAFLELTGKIAAGGTTVLLPGIGALISLWGRYTAKSVIGSLF